MLSLDLFPASVAWSVFSPYVYGDKVVVGDFVLISTLDIVDAGVGEIAWINFCGAKTNEKGYQSYI